MKKRSNAFDLLCGLCIMRMVMLHAVCTTQMEDALWWREVMAWTFFFMSFFFFKAGYFNKGITGKTVPYLRDRFRRLLVPYLSWGALGMVLFCFKFCFLPDGFAKAMEEIGTRWRWDGLSFGNVPLWFLLSFFTTYVSIHFIEKVRFLHWTVLLFPAIGYCLFLHDNPIWFYLNNVFCGTFFFYMGKAWHHVLDRLTKQRVLAVSIVLCIGFVFANIYLHAEYNMRPNVWIGSFWQSMLIIWLSLCGFSGVLLSLPTPRVSVINFIGEHSMVFFVMHYPVIMSYKYICIMLGRDIQQSYLDVAIMMVFGIGLCALAVPYVEKVPWLSGRWENETLAK